MSPAGIVSATGFIAESLWASISNSGARSLADSFHSTRPTETPGIPILASSTISLSPELEFKIKHLTSEILTFTDRIVRDHWVPELPTLFLCLLSSLPVNPSVQSVRLQVWTGRMAVHEKMPGTDRWTL
ncbi:hypothetical protein L873DRAFT_112501 [Choiromyces venosus 120613-1]|uniref:Uncharacterized protein n=1 Tax=Choiromyces venosus 120613-1 TaxID=1336337 RepID=A0A3N4J414_9PEZI|nr:hypothetical protein L873DRAFT_112501 [Choiromyces venosus 120613-1]